MRRTDSRPHKISAQPPSVIAIGALFAMIVCMTALPRLAHADEQDLAELSLEDLMFIEVTSVSKKAQNKSDVAASISVITSEDLRRGGFTSVPEALRTVPGVQVARIDANRWAISARGFNKEFANTLLVLIDGRSVYTPLFGGAYWDIQDYPIEDIERIEVIRGPGGTIWGANAVNGVINVITKHSADTQGVLASGYSGFQEHGGTGRFGMKVGDSTTFRVFGRGFKYEDQDVDQRHDALDEWNQGRAGFRIDTAPTEQDDLMVSADYYHTNADTGVITLAGFDRRNIESKGGNVLAKWDRDLGSFGGITTKAFYDRTYRDENGSRGEEDRHTADVDFQHDFSLNQGEAVEAHLTWGLNYRFSTSHYNGTARLNANPNDKDFHLGNVLLQGRFDLLDGKLSLVGGAKLGGNSWSGFEWQPSGRILIKPIGGHTLWLAASRAIRRPTQIERDLQAIIPAPSLPPGFAILAGSNDQRSEELVSVEFGYRFYAWEKMTIEFSLFHNMYENVQSLTFQPTGVFQFGNLNDVQTTGGEIEIEYRPYEWWRLSLGYSVLEIESDELPSPLAGNGGTIRRSSPQNQIVGRSFFDLPLGFELDASVYWVDGLKGVVPFRVTPGTNNIEQYVRLDLRIGYKPFDWLELALVGQNLIDARHQEFFDLQSNLASEVPRSGYGKVTLRF